MNRPTRKSVMAYISFGLLRLYKYTLGPALTVLGVRCRHMPSCTSYCHECIDRHGFWAGGWMTLARLSRCHPFRALGATSGIDNVPETVQKAPFWAPWRYGRWRGTNTD